MRIILLPTVKNNDDSDCQWNFFKPLLFSSGSSLLSLTAGYLYSLVLVSILFFIIVLGQISFSTSAFAQDQSSVAPVETIENYFPEIITQDHKGEIATVIEETVNTENEEKNTIKPNEFDKKTESKLPGLLNSQGNAQNNGLVKTNVVPDVTENIMKVSGGLLLVIIAIFGSAWFYRRFGNFSPVANDSLKVIGGLTIGQKEKIVLLQVGEEQVLIGVAPGNIQKIHVLETPIKLNEEQNKETNVFSDQLDRALGQWKKTS